MINIIRREPALLVGFLVSLVAALCAFVIHVTPDQQGAIVAVVSVAGGVWVAVGTRDGQVAAILSLGKALLSLALAFGVHWSVEQQALLMTLVSSGVAMFVRTQVQALVPATVPVVQPVVAYPTGVLPAAPSVPAEAGRVDP